MGGFKMPAFQPPKTVSVTHILPHSAKVQWRAPLQGSPTGYEYYLSENAVAPSESWAPNYQNVVSLEQSQLYDLKKNTSYKWWVRALYTGDKRSVWIGGNDFTTPEPIAHVELFAENGADAEVLSAAQSVTFDGILHSETTRAGYDNFSHTVWNVESGEGCALVISGSKAPAALAQTKVWIDFNQDMDFDEEGELMLTTTPSYARWSGSIIIPFDAAAGHSKMRVKLHYSDECGPIDWRELQGNTLHISLAPQHL